MANPDILCVGMAVVDILVEGVDALPKSGETGHVPGIRLAIGGDSVNQSAALAKLGDSAGVVAVVGDDAQGQFVRDRLARIGVDARGLATDLARPTTTVLVLIDPRGEHSFLSLAGSAGPAFGPEHVNDAAVQPGLRALSLASLFYAPGMDHEIAAPIARKARAVGAITLADMVMDQRGYGLDDLAELWPALDYAMPSELEGEILTGSRDPGAIAAAFRRRGVRNVVVKRGSKGVLAFIGDEVFEQPAFDVPVADTTGAGDNFVAGFLHGLVHGFAPQKALRFGCATAALSVGEVGAGAGLKDLAQVEAFLAARGA